MSENLWPDFDRTQMPLTVRRVLIEHGSGIVEKTDGVLKFEVESEPDDQGRIVHNCYLVLQNIDFMYPFMKVVENRIKDLDPYPVTIYADSWPQGVLAGNMGELVKDLGLVFRSDPTQKIVLQLLNVVS